MDVHADVLGLKEKDHCLKTRRLRAMSVKCFISVRSFVIYHDRCIMEINVVQYCVIFTSSSGICQRYDNVNSTSGQDHAVL